MPGKNRGANSGKRVWCFEVYPDSAPKDWMAQVQDTRARAFVSPLHDSDKHESGEPKKPHYHVQVMFGGKKSLKQVREMFGHIAANGYVEDCKSLEGYARYLCHLDNPEKAQYQISDVRELNGADYLGTIKVPGSNRKEIAEMQSWCRENRCYFFSKLMDYAASEKPEWHEALCTRSSMVMYRYVISLAEEVKNEEAMAESLERKRKASENGRRAKAASEEARARAKAQEAEEARKLGFKPSELQEGPYPWENGDDYLSADTRDSGPDFVPPECN